MSRKIDIKVIKGTEKIVLKHLDPKLNPLVEFHKNISLSSIYCDKTSEDFQNLRTALSVTDQKTSINLSLRDWRVAMVAAGINPSLACFMCELASIGRDDVILDPFCSAGVIPISSALYYQAKTVIASDISKYAIRCVYKNAQATGMKIGKEIIIINKDISLLELGDKSVDRIITNPPYGIRTGGHVSNEIIYRDLFDLACRCLKTKGLMVFLTQEIDLVKSMANEYGSFKIESDLKIYHNGLRPHVFVYRNCN